MAKKKQGLEAGERELLRDLQKLASREFVYEDGWCGMVPFNGKLGELQTGPPVPFADLHWRDQADVLRDLIDWSQYPERAWDDEYVIKDNIVAGKRPEQWLEGTSLRESFRLLAEGKTPPPPKQPPEIDLASLRAALGMAEPDGVGSKAEDGKLSLQDLRKEPEQQEKCGENERCKSQEIER
jgi:hypothetical protein